ncbi:MAG: hypothetical protein KJ571_01895 [Bacteroidetes bacterium]|nr:hypothetical protein [Bacteroidota bacterium]
MIKDDLSELGSFEIKLRQNENFEISAEKINSLIDSGFKTVIVKLYGSSKKAAANLGHNETLFENIKKVQSLPDNIVYDFFESKGKISR